MLNKCIKITDSLNLLINIEVVCFELGTVCVERISKARSAVAIS